MRFRDPQRDAVVIVAVCLTLCLNQVWRRNAPWSTPRESGIKPVQSEVARGCVTLYESSSFEKNPNYLASYMTFP